MQKIRRLFLAAAIFALLLFSVSCESESKVMNGGEVTISGPSFIEVTSGEKTISATPSDVKYKYTMNPTWTITADNPAYGATGDTARELTSFDNLGYFTQGIWKFTLIAYTEGENKSEQLLYKYSTNVEVNSRTVNIKINPKDIQYAAGNDADCNLTLSNYKVYIPDASIKYGVGVDSDYVVYYEVKPLESGKTGIGKTEVKAGSFTFAENSDYGTITNEERFEPVSRRVPKEYHKELYQCIMGWDICMEPIPGAMEFCEYVKKSGYGIYVLSNADNTFHDYFPRFAPEAWFDGVMVSSDVHMIKPETKIYEHFLKTYRLIPEECLFVDDRPENIEGAKKAGIPGMIFTGDFQPIKNKIEI